MLKKYFDVCGLGALLFISMSSHAQAVPAQAQGVQASGQPVQAPSHPVPALSTPVSRVPTNFTPRGPLPSAGTIIGSLEGTLAFCTSANPQGAASYDAFDQLITNGQSASAMAELRNSDSYERAYRQITKQLRALSPAEAVAECKPH
jgi:hypothetical protein